MGLVQVFPLHKGQEKKKAEEKLNLMLLEIRMLESQKQTFPVYIGKSLEDIRKNFLDCRVLLHPGDLTNNGSEAEYNRFYKILEQNLPNHIFLCWR